MEHINDLQKWRNVMDKPLTIDEITKIEPGVNNVLEKARKVKSPTWENYECFKMGLSLLVGFRASKKPLRTSQAYETAISYLADALRI